MVGGSSVAIHSGDPDERRMTHRRRRKIPQCVVIGALPLDSSDAEPLRREPAGERIARPGTGPAQLLVLGEVEADLCLVRIQLECGEPERREVRRVVDLDHRPGRPVHEIQRQQKVLAGGVQHREISLEPQEDLLEHLERCRHRAHERRVPPRLGNALEADMALFAQPVERRAAKIDPVLRRRFREGRVDVAGRHRAIVASKRGRPQGGR